MPYNRLGDLQTLTLANNVTMTNPCVILTEDNIIEFMSDMVVTNYTANQVLATLPTGMRPMAKTTSVCFCNTTTRRFFINPDGTITCSHPTTSGTVTVELNGLCVNICDFYYNSTIGNNFPQGTSPL